jgi:hypothetical protein
VFYLYGKKRHHIITVGTLAKHVRLAIDICVCACVVFFGVACSSSRAGDLLSTLLP